VIDLSQSQIDDLHDIKHVCEELQGELVIIGAIAYQLHFPDDQRQTGDIDFAIALDQPDFTDLSARLSARRWRQAPDREHRWQSERGNLFDLIPAGRNLRESGQITWPNSRLTMSLMGFHHVFSAAVSTRLAPDLDLLVITPIVLMLLKLIAYMDDPQRRRKDLSDIRALLSKYEAGSDRIFTDAVGEVSEYNLASAFLLGRDLRSLCTQEELARVREFIECVGDEDKAPWWDFVHAAPRSIERNEQTAREQLETFSFALG